MLQSKLNKSAKWWLLAKLLLTIGALWFIYLKIISHEGSRDYISQLQTAFKQPGSALLILSVFILMMLNWTVEAIKWKYMIDKIEIVKTGRALEAVFSGLTFSFFTPNRIGEYAGRVFHLHTGKRLQATFITIIENISQLMITLITGSIACMIYLKGYMEISPWIFILIRFLLFAFCVFCLLLYFNIGLLEKIFQRFRLTEHWKQILHVFSLYSNLDLLKVLSLSLLRYLIFSLQFYILLRVYGCSFGFFPGLLMISMTFFVMSIVPTFTIAELGVRGAVSAYFFGKLTIDVLPVLNATFSLWLINLAIPALIGAFFIFHFRLGRNGR